MSTLLPSRSVQEVSCVLKPPVYLAVGGAITAGREGSHSSTDAPSSLHAEPSGCQVVDVTLHSSPDGSHRIDFISLQNYYTYSITVLCRRKGTSQQQWSPWKLCIKDKQLMSNCHCEQGGQDRVVLKGAESLTELDDVTDLRLILRQPSPHWREFGVRDIRCFTVADSYAPREEGPDTADLPPSTSTLEAISGRLRDMQGLGVDRCVSPDVGGSRHINLPYEVNLLSYT